MKTHRDDDADTRAYEELRKLAERMTQESTNRITAGVPGEAVLEERVREGVRITRRPDDPAALRISLGEVTLGGGHGESAYLVYRGAEKPIIRLLVKALHAVLTP